MCEASANPSRAPDNPDSLARAEVLEHEIATLCAQINAASYRLLQLIAELDDVEPWAAWGLASCAHWLNWRCGIGMNAAREKVRVAHALKKLPAISAAFASGELSFSKIRAVTRVANTSNENELLHIARHATAAQVEKLVRGYRRTGRLAEAEQAMAQHAARELHYYYADDDSLVIRARLPAEDGAVVLQALDAAMDVLREQEVNGDIGGEINVKANKGTGETPGAENLETETSDATAESPAENISCGAQDVTAETFADENRFARRRADALTLMAETSLRHAPGTLSSAERYQLVVHVTAETLTGDGDGRCALENGGRLAIDTVRRIGCDAGLVRITEDAAGHPLDIGRKTRALSPALRRALQTRDGGCRFPGCTRHRFVDGHHIRHWADGGETKIDNLVLLCRQHHRLVHEGGFAVERRNDGRLQFTRPDGRVIDPSPQLPGTGSAKKIFTENPRGGVAVDASSWIIPGDPLDYGIAIEGLLRNYGDNSRDPGQLTDGKRQY